MKLVENMQLDLQYFLFPSGNPSIEFQEIHNKTFGLWMDVWSKVFKELNFDTSGLEDDFLRQDIIATICHKNEPIAIQLYSFLSIDSAAAMSQRYLKQFPPEFFEKLRSFDATRVMSLEYMTVHPEWRKGKVSFPLGQALIGLSCKVLSQFRYDASIAPARRDYKVHEVIYAWGGEPIVANVSNHNVACDLIAIRKDKYTEHKDKDLQAEVERLWKSRVDNLQMPIVGDSFNKTNKQAA